MGSEHFNQGFAGEGRRSTASPGVTLGKTFFSCASPRNPSDQVSWKSASRVGGFEVGEKTTEKKRRKHTHIASSVFPIYIYIGSWKIELSCLFVSACPNWRWRKSETPSAVSFQSISGYQRFSGSFGCFQHSFTAVDVFLLVLSRRQLLPTPVRALGQPLLRRLYGVGPDGWSWNRVAGLKRRALTTPNCQTKGDV